MQLFVSTVQENVRLELRVWLFTPRSTQYICPPRSKYNFWRLNRVLHLRRYTCKSHADIPQRGILYQGLLRGTVLIPSRWFTHIESFNSPHSSIFYHSLFVIVASLILLFTANIASDIFSFYSSENSKSLKHQNSENRHHIKMIWTSFLQYLGHNFKVIQRSRSWRWDEWPVWPAWRWLGETTRTSPSAMMWN